MAISQPKLKYAEDALNPYLSERTVSIHYNKHTAKYFDTMNKLIKGTPFDKEKDLTKLVSKDALMKADSKLFNNACQAWNHVFYFDGLAPHAEVGEPSPELLKAIEEEFESFDKFKKQFIETATGLFGSGWCWLVLRNGKLAIKTTPNGGNPLSQDHTVPLMTVDVWEHAYYLDYTYDRPEYLENVWNIIDWNTVSERFAGAE